MLKSIYFLNDKKVNIPSKYKKIIDLNSEQIKISNYRTDKLINNFVVKSFNDKKVKIIFKNFLDYNKIINIFLNIYNKTIRFFYLPSYIF